MVCNQFILRPLIGLRLRETWSIFKEIKLLWSYWTALRWLKLYLFNRKRCTVSPSKINHSSYSEVITGVPVLGLGFTLGRLLFLIFINDQPNVVKLLKIVMFADDTTALLSGPKIDCLIRNLINDLKKLKEWFMVNNLILNSSTTKYITFIPCNAMIYLLTSKI